MRLLTVDRVRLVVLILFGAVAVLIAGLIAAPPASALASRSWVSGIGDDANPCSRTLPCKTFPGAISKTSAGGEINALDSGGFGAVTITKAITIDATAVQGGVLVSASNGIVVAAGVADDIVLRGLDIKGPWTNGACGPTGLIGIRVNSAHSVHVEHTRISGMATAGITVAPTSGTATVTVDQTDIRSVCGPGVNVAPAGGVAAVRVTNSSITSTGVGVRSTGGNTLVADTALFGNGAAIQRIGGTLDATDRGNQIAANTEPSNPATTTLPAGATRTWVSGTGDDGNPCSRTTPCKTFAGAESKTSVGGEINALDSGGFGAITITKALTIDGTGVEGGVLISGTNGITVNPAVGEDVILRGLDIVGDGNPGAPCPYLGASGVRILGGRSVHIENTRISGMTTAGVNVVPNAVKTRVVVSNSDIRNSCGPGVRVAPTAGGSADVLVHNTTITNTAAAIAADGGGHVWVGGSTVTGNTIGLAPSGGLIDIFNGSNNLGGNQINGGPSDVLGKDAQSPIACASFPGRIRRQKTTVLLRHTCVTSGGQVVHVSISGLGRLLFRGDGKVLIRERKKKGFVTVTFSAPATEYYLPFSISHTFRVR